MSDHLNDYPLDTARKEIRLLTILPALRSEAPIKCSLQVASLDAFPRYEAISYVWGDIREKQDILLDGRTIQVPTNVRRILQRLRHRMQRRVIWIDYVCIHQDNVAEKNTQVPLMSAIYANATSVIAIISLDNLGVNVADAIDLMMNPIWKEVCWWIKYILGRISAGYEKRLAVLLRNIVDFYYNFLFAEYWTRMWTFQEYQLSQGKPPICICGDVEFPGYIGRNMMIALRMVPERFHKMSSRAEKRGGRLQLQNHYKEIKRHFGKLRFTIVIASYTWVSDKQNYTVLLLLRLASGRKCQNPQDKIYALYGLLPSLQKAYPPDYNKSLSQIIFETAKYILNEKGPDGLEMLDIFSLREDRLENVSIPSWVPDLTTTVFASTNSKAFHSERFGLSYTSREPIHERYPKVTGDHSVLCLTGRPIGKCRPVFRFSSNVKGVLAQIMGVVQMHGDGRHAWDYVCEPENIPYRFLRACSAFSKDGSAPAAIRDPDFDSTRLRTVLEALDMIHQDVDTVLETLAEAGFGFLRDLVPRLYSINVFTIHHTSIVGFGLSEQSVEEEDQVIIDVCQFKMPFVLRTVCGTDFNSSQVYHKLVGFAYVDGICNLPWGLPSITDSYFDYVRTVPYEKILLS